MNLLIKKLANDEGYLDYARIAREHRKDINGKILDAGVVCSLRCVETDRKTLVILRSRSAAEAAIGIDYRTRRKLDVHSGEMRNFELRRVGAYGQLRWAWGASDIRYSIPVKIAVLSGTCSLVLGLLSIVIAVVKR